MFHFLTTQSSEAVTPPTIGAAPTTLTATADADSINLAWVNPDTYTATVIMRKTTGDYSALATAAGDAATYNDTTAVAGTEYTYKVRGVKGGFPTQYSNEPSATISDAPLSAIVTVVNYAALTGAAITVNGITYTEDGGNDGWSATTSNNFTASYLRAVLAGDAELSLLNTNAIITITRVDLAPIGTVTSSDPINLTVTYL